MFQRVRAPSASDVKGGMILMNPVFGCICFFEELEALQKSFKSTETEQFFQQSFASTTERKRVWVFFVGG